MKCPICRKKMTVRTFEFAPKGYAGFKYDTSQKKDKPIKKPENRVEELWACPGCGHTMPAEETPEPAPAKKPKTVKMQNGQQAPSQKRAPKKKAVKK